ncbi:MAG: response regulator, partial [Hyphomicrobiales bacterium]
QVPVIFITAYPDRLLTGERPEPAFLITKPYQPDTVKAIVSQALFFERRARLKDQPQAGA